MALSGFKADFAFQVEVTCGKQPLVQIGIHGADRHIQLRMVGQDMVGGLSLGDQRGDDLVFLMQFPSGHIDPASGIPELFTVFPVGKTSIVLIFMGDRTMIDFFRAPITDIRSLFQPAAAFFFKVFAGLVTGRAGSTFHPAEDDLATGVGLLTVITVDTEVMGIVESAFVVPVGESVCLNFFRDSGRILTEEACDILKGSSFTQFVFNVNTILKGKMFLVAGYKFTHNGSSFYCCQKER